MLEGNGALKRTSEPTKPIFAPNRVRGTEGEHLRMLILGHAIRTGSKTYYVK